MTIMEFESFKLVENDISRSLADAHHHGEQLANTHGDLDGARRAFAAGIAMYEDAEENDRTNATQLMYARIMRDDGFTIKKLLQQGSTEPMPDPGARLTQSRRTTEQLLGLPEDAGVSAFGIAFRALKRLTRRNRDLGYLMAEHGATVGGIGRLVVRHEVEDGVLQESRQLTKTERRAVTAAQKDFNKEQAHGFLVLGNNGYYRTSNAANGARAETAKGGLIEKLKAVKWLGRTAASLGYTARHNRSNFIPALKTTARILKEIRFPLFSRTASIGEIRRHF